MSDLEDVEFYRENDQLVSVFRPGIHTPFFPSDFNDFEMDSMADNPILSDEEQDKENSRPPYTTTPVSERPTAPPVLRNQPFGTRNENVPDYV